MIILTIITRLFLAGVLLVGMSVVYAMITQLADKEQW
jgi:hypothetical protein